MNTTHLNSIAAAERIFTGDGIKAGDAINLAILVGTLTRPPRFKKYDSSPSITTLDVKVRRDEDTTDVVRVTWFDAPAEAQELEESDTVAVLGRVRRYWFGGNQSVTDVVADEVIV